MNGLGGMADEAGEAPRANGLLGGAGGARGGSGARSGGSASIDGRGSPHAPYMTFGGEAGGVVAPGTERWASRVAPPYRTVSGTRCHRAWFSTADRRASSALTGCEKGCIDGLWGWHGPAAAMRGRFAPDVGSVVQTGAVALLPLSEPVTEKGAGSLGSSRWQLLEGEDVAGGFRC